jgi:hypothetical protein
MREALVVECFEDDIDLLLVESPVGLLVAQRGTERLHLARVVSATDAKDDATAREDVSGGKVLRQAQRVPHRSDIEAATNLDVFRSVREVQCHEDGVGNAFSAFMLEVMFGHPEAVVAKAIHEIGHGLGLGQGGCEMRVRVTSLVDRRPAIADVVEVGMTSVQAVKLGDHREVWPLCQPGPDGMMGIDETPGVPACLAVKSIRAARVAAGSSRRAALSPAPK